MKVELQHSKVKQTLKTFVATYDSDIVNQQHAGDSFDTINSRWTGDVEAIFGRIGMNLEDITVLMAAGLLTDSTQDFVVVVVRHDETIEHIRTESSFGDRGKRFHAGGDLEVGENWSNHRALEFVVSLGLPDLQTLKANRGFGKAR